VKGKLRLFTFLKTSVNRIVVQPIPPNPEIGFDQAFWCDGAMSCAFSQLPNSLNIGVCHQPIIEEEHYNVL
jgi:hypothetical protein